MVSGTPEIYAVRSATDIQPTTSCPRVATKTLFLPRSRSNAKKSGSRSIRSEMAPAIGVIRVSFSNPSLSASLAWRISMRLLNGSEEDVDGTSGSALIGLSPALGCVEAALDTEAQRSEREGHRAIKAREPKKGLARNCQYCNEVRGSHGSLFGTTCPL